MEENICELIERFNDIKKNNNLYKSVVQKGYSGAGSTFEKLLGKEPDTSYKPDFKGIEIKTRLGYTKCEISLFSLIPKFHEESAIELLVSTYGQQDKSLVNYKTLRAFVKTSNTIKCAGKYIFELFADRKEEKLKLIIMDKNRTVLNDEVYWSFKELNKRLCTKLRYLAMVTAYPYRRQDGTYFRYFKMSIYKLKSFDCFLRLIECGDIRVIFNVGIHKDKTNFGKIYDHGTSFKLKNSSINKLFEKMY